MRKKILVTGAAGFIGFHLCKKLISEGCEVIGLDNINDYYDKALKFARLAELGVNKDLIKEGKAAESNIYKSSFIFFKLDIKNKTALDSLFEKENFDFVCNLAAQVGVRYSIEKPKEYIENNILGFFNILECCKDNAIKRLVYSSSSSVYGNSKITPFTEDLNLDSPISMYAATKKSNELMAHTYSHLYGIETIGLRFFTVYGPWGRPDMAMFLFADAILKGKTCVLPYEKRKELLESLDYVDKVIPEDNWEQKTVDIKENEVDTFVMGSDWEGKFDELKKYCKVIYFPRTEGISTTKLESILKD